MRISATTAAAIALALVACVEDAEPPVDASAEADGGASAGGGVGSDDAIAPPDMAAIPEQDAGEDPCPGACARVSDCSAELCVGYDADALAASCAVTCGSVGAFAAVAGGAETCQDVVDFAAQSIGGAYAEACAGGGAGREWSECALFAEHFVECLVAACPGGASVEAQLVAAYAGYCNENLDGGGNPQEFANLGALPCEHQVIREIIAQQLEPDPEDPNAGGLASLCEEGPSPDVETCTAACARLAPCIPDDADPGALSLRDLDRCVFTCAATAAIPDPVWECIEGASTCDEVYPCFMGPPEVENCDVYGARVAACAVEDCPGVISVEETLGAILAGACAEIVQQGNLTAEQVAGVSAETSCDDPAVAGLVSYLTTDGPAEEDGGLVPVCEAPAQEPALCEAACAVLSPCAPVGSPIQTLRDPRICEYLCVVEAEVPEEVWSCVRDAEMCDAALACLPRMEEG